MRTIEAIPEEGENVQKILRGERAGKPGEGYAEVNLDKRFRRALELLDSIKMVNEQLAKIDLPEEERVNLEKRKNYLIGERDTLLAELKEIYETNKPKVIQGFNEDARELVELEVIIKKLSAV